MPLDLEALESSARKNGWSQATASVAEVRFAATLLHWKEVAGRTSDPSVTDLRPKDRQNARPRSLSATYGLGPQPLHTDGAHLSNPPDLLLLFADEPSITPTLLWSTRSTSSSRTRPSSALAHGIFLVDKGRESFFTTSKLGALGVRYDPGCMIPCDQRARAAAQFFVDIIADATEYHWTFPRSVLIIDNTTTLHARAEVPSQDKSRHLRRIVFTTRKSM